MKVVYVVKNWRNYRVQLKGQPILIDQNLLLNETDINSGFCYSMIWK